MDEVSILVQDGYAIWYNHSPALVLENSVYALSSMSSRGEARISFADGGSVEHVLLAHFDSVSDHGSPALVQTDSNIIYAIANHWSPLYIGSIGIRDRKARILSPEPLDEGWCTYPSFLNVGGRLLLFYTRGHRDEQGGAYRDYVVRFSDDSGFTWSDPKICIAGTPGSVAYPAPPFALPDGRLCIVFSNLISPLAKQMPTEHIYVRFSEDGGETWIDPNCGEPAWRSPTNVMFQVFDACAHNGDVRTVCLCADGPWDAQWSAVDAYVVDLGTGASSVISGVSFDRYPNGAYLRRDDPSLVLVAEQRGRDRVIGEWEVSSQGTKLSKTYSAANGLTFPFQASDGRLFAHSRYRRGARASDFYADIVAL